ncbi:GAF domain-containing protein [Sphaerothrix gracilis]|uniref:GAF domain-containing protein n=1 Tax=Sphaerothrix gracilis TaxID=3151835 RepID=UPI0031FC5D9F
MLDMLSELEQLSLTLDFLNREEARQVTEVVSEKIKENLNAHIIDILWRQEGRYHDILQPFSSLNVSRREPIKPFEIREDSVGIWPWVYRNKEAIWIEKIHSSDLKQPIENKVTGQLVESRDLEFFRDTDSILAVPLLFRDALWGIFCIELPVSGNFTTEIVEFIKRLSKPIANIIWKADAYELNDTQTSQAIVKFKEIVQGSRIQVNPYRTGFIARPFTSETSDFYELEDCIREFLVANNIQARRYIHPPGNRYVVSEIMKQIKDSHFGIVDITGFSPNIMLELGMMMILNKKFILLHQKVDNLELPFDIQNYHCYKYEIRRGGIYAWSPGDSQAVKIEEILKSFIPELYRDPVFRDAKAFIEIENLIVETQQAALA